MIDVAELVKRFPDGVGGKRIHAIGAGGSGISAVLRMARERGAVVSGCDMAETNTARRLTAEGIPVTHGHDPAHLAGADLVLRVPAQAYLDPHNPEYLAAIEQGIPVAFWQAFLGYLMHDRIGVSVAGVHGKGSTTAMLGALAIAGGLDPTVEVGATVKDWSSNIRLGNGPHFIHEADEWNYNFLNYTPRLALLNAVEYDHPEFFDSYEAIREAFVRFLRGMDTSVGPEGALPPTIVVNADSPGCLDTLEHLGRWPGEVRRFGIISTDVDVRGEDIQPEKHTTFALVIRNKAVGRVALQMPGEHNVANAVAAAAAADALGVPPEVIVPALSAFSGLRRRFEVVEDGDVTFIDDYAHHPHAIALTLATARLRYPGQRIVAVFQPTLFTRTHRFLVPFSEAFDAADAVVIVEIQPSREHDTGLIHGSALAEKIAQRDNFAGHPDAVRYGGTYEETAALLREMRQPGDVVVVMGSGPVNAVIAGARLS